MHPHVINNTFSLWQRLLIGILLSFLAIIGFMGNLTASIVFGRNNHLSQTSISYFILNLAMADMLQCINLLFMIAAISGITWYEANDWCILNGFATHSLVTASVFFLSLISINGYFIIVKKSNRNIFARRKVTIVCITLVWSYSSLVATSPLVGWSESFFPAKLFCQHDDHASPIAYVIMCYAVLSLRPLTLCFCTWKVMIFIKRARQRVEKHVTTSSTQCKEERRITLMLLVVIISYFMLVTPASIINILSILLKYKIEPWFDISTMIIFMLNHVNNPVIYGLMNRNFREAGLKLFCRRKTRNTSFQELQQRVVKVECPSGSGN